MSDIEELIFIYLLGFLMGFRIAAHMGKKQVERLKKIWEKT